MRCESCGGSGVTIFARAKPGLGRNPFIYATYAPCPVCNGSGIASCCDEAGARSSETPIEVREAAAKGQRDGEPLRVQRQRTKGWRMPPNTVYVGRPTRWGNPFRLVNEDGWPLILDGSLDLPTHLTSDQRRRMESWDGAEDLVVELFRERCLDRLPDLAPLRDRNLCCWCPLEDPCHADVLLELANRPTSSNE